MTAERMTQLPPNAVAFNLEDASKAVGGVSRSFLYGEMRAGRLRSKMIGRRRVIPADALRAWIEAAPDGGAVHPAGGKVSQ
jgi:excisionase family DNA binding protein